MEEQETEKVKVFPEEEVLSSRESTPHLLEPLNYEIIQLDDDDDDEEEDEENDGDKQQLQQQQQQVFLEEEEDRVEEIEEIKDKNQPPSLKNLNKTNRPTNSHHNLRVDISRSIKWHEIIQENNHETTQETTNTPKLKKKKLN